MDREPRAFRVGISGSYGGLNLGDEAILHSIVEQLRQSLPVEITVFSRDAKDTLRTQDVDRAVDVRVLARDEIIPEIERLDLFILGGGGILFDGESKIYLREVQIAQERGIPVMTYAIGAGPLKEAANQKLVQNALNRASVVTVRERSAKKVLEESGVERDVIVTADPALLLKPEPLPSHTLHREGMDLKHRIIGFSVREPGMAAPDINEETYHGIIANAADYMVDRYNADIVFVPMEPRTRDLQHSHAVMAQMLRPERADVLKGEYSPGQLLSLVKHFDFAVGMRLHFLIFAALQEVPFVALPYASKVSGFLEAVQVDAPPLHLVNAGRVIAYIDHVWDGRRELIARIRRMMPELQRRARMTNELAVRLLKEKVRKEETAPAPAR